MSPAIRADLSMEPAKMPSNLSYSLPGIPKGQPSEGLIFARVEQRYPSLHALFHDGGA